MGNTIPAERTKSTWLHWIEPWYFVYALLGMVMAGLLPVLLPLLVSQTGSAAQVGLVMAALNLGGLSAPAWGSLADRYRLHHVLLVGGLLIVTIGLAGLIFSSQPLVWLGLALVQGIGAAGAATVANLFIVEVHPKSEWDERIGWLQTFYGVGQVAGLLLAGILSEISLPVGLLAAAGLSAAGAVTAWLTTHTPPGPSKPKPVLSYPARHGEWTVHSPQRLFHHLDWKAVKKIGPALHSPFGVFLLVWVFTMAGPAGLFSQFPVLMQKVFHIIPGISSTGFAIAAGAGLLLYSPAGQWSEKIGPVGVLRAALGIRIVALVGLFGIGLAHLGGASWLPLSVFGVVVLAWSLISVSGTALAARLSPVKEGEGMGIFNAVNALAGVIGSVLGGWVAAAWGYNNITIAAVLGVVISLAVSIALPFVNPQAG